MKNHVVCYNFPCVNVCEMRIRHLLQILLDIQCPTFYIENRSVKRANSHYTICSLLTPTHIIFQRQKVGVLV